MKAHTATLSTGDALDAAVNRSSLKSRLTGWLSPARRILAIVGPGYRRRMAWVLALTIAVGVLEFVSIGGMFPLLTMIFDPSAAGGNSGIWRMVRALGISPAAGGSIMPLAVLVLTLLVVKMVVTAYSLRVGYRFTFDVQVGISHRMLQRLLARDYEYFLGRNSTLLLKNVTTEVLMLAGGVLIPAISVVSQVVVIISIGALLAWISPVAAVVVFPLIVGLTAGLYVLSHRRLTQWGKERERRLGEMHNVAHQALLGIKTVKTHGSERAFLGEFRNIGRVYADLNTSYQTAAAVPPLLLELVLFGGLTALMLFFAWRGRDVVTILPMIGLVGAAAFRLLPAARRMFTDAVTVRYYWSSLEAVERELQGLDAAESKGGARGAVAIATPADTDMRFERDIQLDGVTYRYPDGTTVLRDISLQIPACTKLAIVGSSGAGKSTLIDLLLGLLAPVHGRMLVDDTMITPAQRAAWIRQIGYVSQQIFLMDGTVLDNVAFGVPADEIDEERARTALRRAHLLDFIDALPERLETRVGENGVRLSGGERQRLGIARALYRQPRLLVLDEATSALDAITEQAVNADVLRECADITVIIVAHRLSTIRDCERIVLLDAGRIAASGTYDQLIARSPIFAEMHRQATATAHT